MSESAVDPIERFNQWFAEAQASGVPLPETMALATADTTGQPSVRFVLLKQADPVGFVFFTNAHSRKGRELGDNPRVSLAFYWHTLARQVRVDGHVHPVSAADADAYWNTRPRESQLAALASNQSEPLANYDELVERWKGLRHTYAHRPVPRPAHWVGYRVIPAAIEFWTQRDHRLHRRELFVHTTRGWRRQLLQP